MVLNAAVAEWLEVLREAVASGRFVKLSLNKPTPAADDLKSVDVRPIVVKRALKLSFTYHHKTRDIVKNHDVEASAGLLAEMLEGLFDAGRLCTLEADVHVMKQGGAFTLKRQAPTQTQAPELSHDRAKQRLLQAGGKGYLYALGLTDAQGQVLKSAQDKFRQINKYIETLDGLVKQLPAKEVLRVADMGSGKGYLTFALYDHLAHTLNMKVQVTGVEYRPDMVSLCNQIAKDAGFTGLSFVQGTIADTDCSGVDVVIALHACDTATDDALFKAIQAQAGLIVVAPCCHKQIRRGMPASRGHDLDFILKYGTYTERMAEMITDSLRAQLLELHGYAPNVFEFISDAHTPKNVMIVATQAVKPADAHKVRAAIEAAKAQFGIRQHYLEGLLAGEPV